MASGAISLGTAQSLLSIFLFSWHLLPSCIPSVLSQQGLLVSVFSDSGFRSVLRPLGSFPSQLASITTLLIQMSSKVNVLQVSTVTKTLDESGMTDRGMNEWSCIHFSSRRKVSLVVSSRA